ncbi:MULTISPECIES: hypothetical protein [Rhodococcus]|uniref:hypothetical protein n=1 Tax=Rhodococcus TaxID=1827 RepID=UPI000F257CD9|nr:MULTISPECIES: hypothetical protein [Rhodococcus]
MAKRPSRKPWSATEVVEGFILRARRIVSHSLLVEKRELMGNIASGKWTVMVTEHLKSGEATYELKADFPPEESIESLTARVRPVIESGEPIYYEKVLSALAELVPPEKWNESLEPIDWWRSWWDSVAKRTDDAQAYLVINAAGSATDTAMMYRWLYSDTIHADQLNEAMNSAGVDERFRAACTVLARVCSRVEDMLFAISFLVEEGLLTVRPEAFSREVVVSDPNVRNTVQAYASSDLTGDIPTDLSELDPEIWQPMHKAVREAGLAPNPCPMGKPSTRSPLIRFAK